MTHSAFELKDTREIPLLGILAETYEHRKTGASHYHLCADNSENAFMVAFRTVPKDSTGVAHILEHTALCGSERFPVRDPFFLMIRRSLNTFMNAFTGSDYTGYPFATQNRKDFYNLLGVYLDAVFFPTLDPLDFAQEGHRIEFENADDTQSSLTYKGVVFNEMKGEMSSPISTLYEELSSALFPENTYHFNSGGDPAEIPNLTHDQLVDFHRSHYHPSNAMFLTFGDIPANELQARFESMALHRFERSPRTVQVDLETRLRKPVHKRARYAIPEEEETDAKTHVVLAWLLGENTDLDMLMKCRLLADVLLSTSASPLRRALETTELASAPSPLCGLESQEREMSFVCGVEGTDVQHVGAIEDLILSTLQQVADEGVPQPQLAACLHQIELHQREVGGDGYPYGLQLLLTCLPGAIHRGDPVSLLEMDHVLAGLRHEIEDPSFIPSLIRELLLENNHRVTLTMEPDTGLHEEKNAREQAVLSAIQADLSDREAEDIVVSARYLRERQETEDDLSLLPSVGLQDVELAKAPPEPSRRENGLTVFRTGTNGLVYHQVVSPLPRLTAKQWPLLPIFTSLLPEIGSAERGYLETQHLQHLNTGGLSAFTTFRADVRSPDQVLAAFTVGSRALVSNLSSMLTLVSETRSQPNFHERQRIRELIRQLRTRREASLTEAGHDLAMTAAAAAIRPVPMLMYQLVGFQGIRLLKELDDGLSDDANLDQLIETLREINSSVQTTGCQQLGICDAASENGVILALSSIDHVAVDDSITVLKSPESPFRDWRAGPSDQAWLTSTQVNFCASVFPTVAESHKDGAALAVLAGVLRNGFLHGALREKGGAYGGGATHDAANGVFRFYSYRDPNLMKSFDAFEDSIKWLEHQPPSFKQVEESILGLVSGLDAPGSPAGECRQAFVQTLYGRDAEHMALQRDRLLSVTQDDVIRVSATYLKGIPTRAVLTSERHVAELSSSFSTFSV